MGLAWQTPPAPAPECPPIDFRAPRGPDVDLCYVFFFQKIDKISGNLESVNIYDVMDLILGHLYVILFVFVCCSKISGFSGDRTSKFPDFQTPPAHTTHPHSYRHLPGVRYCTSTTPILFQYCFNIVPVLFQ